VTSDDYTVYMLYLHEIVIYRERELAALRVRRLREPYGSTYCMLRVLSEY